jgi:hypothetical protein
VDAFWGVGRHSVILPPMRSRRREGSAGTRAAVAVIIINSRNQRESEHGMDVVVDVLVEFIVLHIVRSCVVVCVVGIYRSAAVAAVWELKSKLLEAAPCGKRASCHAATFKQDHESQPRSCSRAGIPSGRTSDSHLSPESPRTSHD